MWYLYDGHGNVRNLADQSGGLTDSYSYNAYGIRLVKNGDTENMYYYCGEQMDEATGLYYLRARYMNPLTATFTQRDSYEGELESPLTQNRYLYAGGNPVMYSDPGGNEFTIQGMLTSVEGLAIISAVMVVSYHNLFASNLQMKAQMYVLEMNGLTTQFVYLFLSEIKEKKIFTPIEVPQLVYNLIIDLVPPEIKNILIIGFPKRKEEYGACVELGPQVISRLFIDVIAKVKGKSYKKYDPKEIEKKYGLKKGQFHREIKPDILADLSKKDSLFRNLMRKVGKNPDIYLSDDGQIEIVSTIFKDKYFITDLYIHEFLP